MRVISTLQSFGIILVVLGHSNPGTTQPVIAAGLHKYIYSFHMPLFMAISGFLFTYHGGVRGTYTKFIKKKAVRLLIPYFIISSIAFMPKVLLSKYAMRPIELSFVSFMHNLFYPLDNVIIFFWFLPTIFLIFLVSPILDPKNTATSLRVAVITGALIACHLYNPLSEARMLNLSGVCSYLIFFWVGCLVARNWNSLEGFFTGRLLLSVLFAATIILNIINPQLKVVYFLIALSGILMSFCLCQQYTKYGFKFIDFIAGYSYQIYLLSWFPQIFLSVVGLQILSLNFYVVATCMFIGGLFIPIVMLKLVNERNRFYRSILGL